MNNEPSIHEWSIGRRQVQLEGKPFFLPNDVRELTLKEFSEIFELPPRAKRLIYVKAGGPNGSVVDVAQLRSSSLMRELNVGKVTVDAIQYGINELRKVYGNEYLSGKLLQTLTPFERAKTEKQQIECAIQILKKKDYLVVPPEKMINFMRDHCNWSIRKDA